MRMSKSELTSKNLMTKEEAAEYLSVSTKLLDAWRYKGYGPRHIKISNAVIRYRPADIDMYLDKMSVIPYFER